jgi:hypothetical protein
VSFIFFPWQKERFQSIVTPDLYSKLQLVESIIFVSVYYLCVGSFVGQSAEIYI